VHDEIECLDFIYGNEHKGGVKSVPKHSSKGLILVRGRGGI